MIWRHNLRYIVLLLDVPVPICFLLIITAIAIGFEGHLWLNIHIMRGKSNKVLMTDQWGEMYSLFLSLSLGGA